MAAKKTFEDTLIAKFGNEIIKTFDGETPEVFVDTIKMRLQSLVWVIGKAGIPRGRIIEISGAESSGKSTLCYEIAAAAQLLGCKIGYVDVENATDMPYMEKCGVDTKSNFILIQPDYGEQALTIVEAMIDEVDVIIVDSIAFLIPKAELDGKMTDQQIGLQSRMMTKNMRRITTSMKGSKTCIIFVNQLRAKIGMSFGYGPTTTTPGGNGVKHAASVRIEMKKTKPIKSGTDHVGFFTRMRVIKNKIAPPSKQAEVPVIFNRGIDYKLDYINLLLTCKILKKRNGQYFIGPKAMGKTWHEVYKKIYAKKSILKIVNTKLKAKMGDRSSLIEKDETTSDK